MLRRTLSNYEITRIIAAVLAVLALALGHMAIFGAIALALLTLIGLGAFIPQLRFFGPFICRGNDSRRCVALTFDDGPDSHSTPALLELLRERSVKAAFFCVGNRVVAHPDLAARIADGGHLVGNHTYTHNKATNLYSVGRLRMELARTQTVIQQATGVAPLLYRPPMGLSNPRAFRVARSLGLTVVGWSARGLDTRITEPERIVARIERRLEPGTIILLHDGNIPSERLIVTVKMLLDRLHALEYEVVRLDQLLA
jgi:peptidoglycan/xylan/chitin deacetylase (PgdA/CDA1 family)